MAASALVLYIAVDDIRIYLKDIFFPTQTVDEACSQIRARLKDQPIASEFVLRTCGKFNTKIPQFLLPSSKILEYDLTSGVRTKNPSVNFFK